MKTFTLHTIGGSIALLVLHLSSFSMSVRGSTIRTIAMTSQAAPGGGASYRFRGFNLPVINNRGEVAFRGWLIDLNNVIDKAGIWKDSASGLGKISVTGDGVPGAAGGTTFQNFGSQINMNDRGITAFLAAYQHTTGIDATNDRATYLENAQSFTLVARLGSQPFGEPPGSSFTTFGVPLLNNNGDIAYHGSVNFGSGGSAVWAISNGQSRQVMNRSMTPPGAADGSRFAGFFGGSVLMDGLGRVTFGAALEGGAINDFNNQGLWHERNGQLSALAVEGQQAPGRVAGTNFGFTRMGNAVVNSAGQAAFYSSITGPDAPGAGFAGLWRYGDDKQEIMAWSGLQADGAATNAFYSGFGDLSINSQGQVAFRARLSGAVFGGDSLGIWSGVPGKIKVVVLEGQQASGLPEGIVFGTGRFAPTNFETTFLINSLGQTAFIHQIMRKIDGVAMGEGIWVRDQFGVLQLISKVGDSIEISPGVFRTIATLNFVGGGGNETGATSGFNDRGELAFFASFTDGSSGIFVSSKVAIPEPSMGIIIGVSGGCAWLWVSRRRSRNLTSN